MQLTINGEACTCAEGLTVAALLREREHDATTVVVEHNGRIVPAADFAATALNEGDVLEIVQFVGGG
ncbi:sulfur carrier protein ThiS [Desulfovibrio piger]|uniref:sulfur carrier protein ThiS n=1 Tax=Desulfovibrio piger TaxID=901 RepID=UPI003F0E5828